MAKAKHMTRRQVAKARGFASGLEDDIARQLQRLGIDYKYEDSPLFYKIPEKQHRYTPDFFFYRSDGRIKMIVESKGIWTTADRAKMKYIREQHPEIDIRMVFTRSKDIIYPTSKTTYGQWCDKLGIPYADKLIPQEWLDEVKDSGN